MVGNVLSSFCLLSLIASHVEYSAGGPICRVEVVVAEPTS